jgi:hypothetical protein
LRLAHGLAAGQPVVDVVEGAMHLVGDVRDRGRGDTSLGE